LAQPTILVVDDEPLILAVVSKALSAKAYEVVAVDCPHKALALAQERTTPFDLVVSDVVMPEICGPELIRKIWRVWPHTAVVFMSGYLSREELPTAVGFLTKPFALGDLFAVVEAALDPRGRERGFRSSHAEGA